MLPEQPIRQWVLSFPFQLRFLFASRPQLMGRVLGIVYRAISSHLIQSFHRTHAPDRQELTELVHAISHRVAGFLEREGILERDEENSYLNLEEGDEDPMQQVLGCSVSYRIAVGPQQGCKVFMLQTIPAWEEQKLERLARYITRPAVSEKRLSLTPSGNIRYQLKTPYSDGTTHVIFEPLDFIAKLVALVPKPRVNLTRFHGVLFRVSCPPPFGPA